MNILLIIFINDLNKIILRYPSATIIQTLLSTLLNCSRNEGKHNNKELEEILEAFEVEKIILCKLTTVHSAVTRQIFCFYKVFGVFGVI